MTDARLLARIARTALTYRAAELFADRGARWESPPLPRPPLEDARREVDAALAGLRIDEESRPLGIVVTRDGAWDEPLPGASRPIASFARSRMLDLRLDAEARAYVVWDGGLGPRYASPAFDSAWHYLEVVARLGADRAMPDWSRAPATIEVWFQHPRVADVAAALDLRAIDEATGASVSTWESALPDVSLVDFRIPGHATHAVAVTRDASALPAVLEALTEAPASEVWLPVRGLGEGSSPAIDARYRQVANGAASTVLARGEVSYWTHERSLARYDALVATHA